MQSAGSLRPNDRANDRAHGCPGGGGLHFWAQLCTRSAGLDRAAAASRAAFDVLDTRRHHDVGRYAHQRRRRDRANNRSSHGLSTRRGEGFRPRLRTRSRARLPRGREGLRRRPVEGLLQEAAHELEVVDRDAVQRRRVIGRARRRVVGRVRVGHGHGGHGRAGRGEGRGRGGPRRKGPPRRLVDRRKRFHCWESRIG